LSSVKAGRAAQVYLFLGPDAWRRDECRRALLEHHLPPEEREQGYTRLDLDEITLSEALDDASSYSLFASQRFIVATSAEAAIPRGEAAQPPDELARFVKNPPPGVVLVFQSSRYEFDGDDKAKTERVKKFFASIPAVVEFAHPSPLEARALAQRLAKQAGFTLRGDALDMLVEATAGNASRIATEVEKLRLLAGEGGAATSEHVQLLVPDARENTIFNLVAAMGRRDRRASLEILDTLVRDGEYLPLALSFLATQFRHAISAKESRLGSAQAIQTFFSRQGVPMWRARAEQIHQTASSFSLPQMRSAVGSIFEADRGLRDIRPDDRTVMERFILQLTSRA
jgi:DNA polymerase III subunit delta